MFCKMIKSIIYVISFSFLVNVVYNKTIEFNQKVESAESSKFQQYTLVQPTLYHVREKRHISSTLENNQHLDQLQITLDINGEKAILDLILNKQLIPKGFFHRYQKDGEYKLEKPSAEAVNLCQYYGKIQGKPNSWAAISTCDGISGTIFDGFETYYIEKDSNLVKTDKETSHIIYKYSDLKTKERKCGYENSVINHDHFQQDYFTTRHKREIDTKVKGPYNANLDSKYVEFVLVYDNKMFKEMQENLSKIADHAKTVVNIMNAIYSPLNIYIALVGVVTWTEQDEIGLSSNGDQTLTNFLRYRRQKLINIHPNDNAHLITKTYFDNGVVGKSLKGPICTYEYSGGVSTSTTPIGLLARLVAHELGHNFGMEHDTPSCECAQEHCMMNSIFHVSNASEDQWSSCSKLYLLRALNQGMDYCLRNKPVSIFDGPTCGNGFVEQGEQCDCGLPDYCNNSCCNATTCMLHNNASCATGECCDLDTCQPKPAGVSCRSTDLECDLPEYCDGESEFCPSDTYRLNGEICAGGEAYCYKGYCKTQTDQCKLLWGYSGESAHELCYSLNSKGTRHGNCGYVKQNSTYLKCKAEDIRCGMLQCKHLNERLEFGMESVSVLSHTFINHQGSILPCRTAIIDLGLDQMDPGLTPNGVKCGEGKMCVNQKCEPVSKFTEKGQICSNCNGNGWCNNNGHCHCKIGFAPSDCILPGPGGSIDSGPASDPKAVNVTNETVYNTTDDYAGYTTLSTLDLETSSEVTDAVNVTNETVYSTTDDYNGYTTLSTLDLETSSEVTEVSVTTFQDEIVSNSTQEETSTTKFNQNSKSPVTATLTNHKLVGISLAIHVLKAIAPTVNKNN